MCVHDSEKQKEEKKVIRIEIGKCVPRRKPKGAKPLRDITKKPKKDLLFAISNCLCLSQHHSQVPTSALKIV
jgi:hypothetical protein